VATISSLVAGILCDRIGRKNLIYVAQFLMAGAAAGFFFVGDLVAAMLVAVPAGLAYGAFTSVEWALACNLLPQGEAARYMGIWNISSVVPQIFAAAIAGPVGSWLSGPQTGLGWRVDFLLIAVFCVVGAYFLRYVRETVAASDGTAGPLPSSEE
jgi:MFS family permease